MCVCLALGLSLPHFARAGTQLQFTTPQGNQKIKNGLRASIESNWLDGNGYRPVDVTLIPTRAGAAPAARTIRVELAPNDWGYSQSSFAVMRDVEIPEGSVGPITQRILVPQTQSWRQLGFRAFEDDRELEDLRGSGNLSGNVQRHNRTEAIPNILVVHDGALPLNERRRHKAALSGVRRGAGALQNAEPANRLPDVRMLLASLPRPTDFDETEEAKDAELMRIVDTAPHMELIRPEDVPQRWLALTATDVVIVSRQTLDRLAAEASERRRAIDRWTLAGGTLCVWGAGPRFEHLGRIEKQLKLGPIASPAEGDAMFAGWKTPHRADYGRGIAELQSLGRIYEDTYYPGMVTATDDGAEQTLQTPPIAPVPEVPTFVWRDCSLGTVVALGPDDPFPGTEAEWRWLLRSLEPDRWMWYRRHGVSFARENDDYWNFLVPGVGFAPVNAFCVLITVFVVLIGPVNYWLLRRLRRLHLLLITVPGGAALACMGLFGYALVSDGLGVRVRARSFTELDQPNGRAVAWSRQSYYAGLVPSRGLEFPETAAVYPIDARPSGYYDRSQRRRSLVWENGQNLRDGFMQSRVVSQTMVVQPQQTGARLKVTPAGDGRSAPTVENQLGTRIEMLWLCDRSGNYFRGRDVAPKGSCRLAAAELSPIQAELRATVAAHRPQPPEGFDPDSYRQGSWFFPDYRSYYWGRSDGDLSRPTVNSSLMEQQIASLAHSAAGRLTPGTYVAIVEEPPTVAVAVESARHEGCFHVILGRW